MGIFERLFLLAAALAGTFLLAAPASAAIVRFQPPCNTSGAPCLSVDASQPLPATLRGFSFNAPGPGRAVVQFHGTMYCASELTTRGFIDLVSQITTSASVTPFANGPGGLRNRISILPDDAGTSDSLNLASTRAFAITQAGPQSYFFAIKALQREGTCHFYNLVFSVEFFAAAEASLVRFQSPCGTGDSPCHEFAFGQPLPASIRSFAFAAPGPGRAAVTFNGSMICINQADEVAADVHIVSQIGTDQSDVPSGTDPGALVHRIKLHPRPQSSAANVDTFNLFSTRTFGIGAAGNRTFHFKLRSIDRTSGSDCSFYNLTFSLVFIPANAAPLSRFQEPCTAPEADEPCRTYNFDEALPNSIRSFTITAPRPGRAVVTFHGSLICTVGEETSAVVDIVTQIDTKPNVIPSPGSPGGLRHAIRFIPFASRMYDTFSLASTRAFDIPAAGTTTFHFKLRSLRRDFGTVCSFYNLAFSAVFI